MENNIRISKVLRELNISLKTAVDFLKRKNITIIENPNSKVDSYTCKLLIHEFCRDKSLIIEMISDVIGENFYDKNEFSLSVGEHRKFRIIEQKERSTILKDELTDLTYPSKKISKLVGDKVYMQISSLENSEKPSFKYSALNDFKENLEYEFDVVEKLDNGYLIENSEDYTSFIPFSYEKYIINGKKIKLTIERIDKEKNHLIFQSKESFNRVWFSADNNRKDANSLFTLGEKYEFKVEGFRTIDQDVSIILLDYKGYKSTVKSFAFQNIDNLPETVICKVSYVSEDKIKLFQDRYAMLINLYKEGNKYEFNVVALENDSTSNSRFLTLSDKYGITHKLYNNEFQNDEFEEYQISQNIWLYVKRIDEKGHLVLDKDVPERSGSFTHVESIFDFIKKSNSLDKYFYFIEDEIKKDIYRDKPYSQLFEDYKKRENLWVFSYLSFLNEFILNTIKENQIEKAIEFSDLYLEIEEWDARRF
nr:hypothetical protein [uncultured Flavobacterium sp.]